MIGYIAVYMVIGAWIAGMWLILELTLLAKKPRLASKKHPEDVLYAFPERLMLCIFAWPALIVMLFVLLPIVLTEFICEHPKTLEIAKRFVDSLRKQKEDKDESGR